MKQAQELVQNELALLQSLGKCHLNFSKLQRKCIYLFIKLVHVVGFEISVDHPHTHVVKCTQLVKGNFLCVILSTI